MDLRDRRSGVTKPDALLAQLTRIADALDALVMLNAAPEPQEPSAECEHAWVDLGDERECPKCQTREKTS